MSGKNYLVFLENNFNIDKSSLDQNSFNIINVIKIDKIVDDSYKLEEERRTLLGKIENNNKKEKKLLEELENYRFELKKYSINNNTENQEIKELTNSTQYKKIKTPTPQDNLQFLFEPKKKKINKQLIPIKKTIEELQKEIEKLNNNIILKNELIIYFKNKEYYKIKKTNINNFITMIPITYDDDLNYKFGEIYTIDRNNYNNFKKYIIEKKIENFEQIEKIEEIKNKKQKQNYKYTGDLMYDKNEKITKINNEEIKDADIKDADIKDAQQVEDDDVDQKNLLKNCIFSMKINPKNKKNPEYAFNISLRCDNNESIPNKTQFNNYVKNSPYSENKI